MADDAGASKTAMPLVDIKTQHALFRATRFAELPGWRQDDLESAWDALQSSCTALAKRDDWRPLCAKAARLTRKPGELRAFVEQEFSLFRILDTDASRDGDVTGYYEPLINGSLRAEGAFTVPVYATPKDLFTLDWKTIATAQRRGIVQVVKSGQKLTVVASRQPGSYALDASRFDLDTRDRIWRLQLVDDRAVPYRTRADIESAARLDAAAIAYVDDALALYAMQIQGSGRIRLRDGTVLRVQYAQQNGHPFRPVRVVAKAPEVSRTRGIGSGTEEPETFEIDNGSGDVLADGGDPASVVGNTRSLKPSATQPTVGSTASTSDALVAELLGTAQRKPAPKPPPAPATATTPLTAGAPKPTAPTPRAAALTSDPSYVFFRVAADQSPTRGPIGALGVPLTPGRSIAVDPRITPLGYPVYLSAPAPTGSALPFQRLVMAQDTGGAIRGAIRADFFWGSGGDAGRQAMRTRQRGQMWLMLPHSEAARLQQSGLTRSGRTGASPRGGEAECLIADEAFCSEVND